MAGRPAKAAFLACLLQGSAAVRVQTELTEEVLAKGQVGYVEKQSGKKDEGIQHVMPILFGKTLTVVVQRTAAKSSLEFGYAAEKEVDENGEELDTQPQYIQDMRLDFLEDQNGMYDPAYQQCRQGFTQKCQLNCGWFLRGRCKRRCATKEFKEDCFAFAGGRQVVVSGKDGFDMTHTWPEQLRSKQTDLTFEFTQQITADFDSRYMDEYEEGKKRASLRHSYWRVKINGREASWLNKPRLLELTTEDNTEQHPNAFIVRGMTLVSSSVSEGDTCTQPCDAQECTSVQGESKGKSSCYAQDLNSNMKLVSQDHCFHYSNRGEEGDSADEYDRECGVKKQSTGKLSSCCTGYAAPLSDSTLDVLLSRTALSPKGPWLSVLTGELGSQIAFDICKAYQGDLKAMSTLRNPSVCKQMAERGEKVRLEGRVAFDEGIFVNRDRSPKPIYRELLIVYRPLTQERMHLPTGMFTSKFQPEMKESSLPAGYWGITVNDDGYVTKVDPGSYGAMQGIVPNRFFINQINEFAFGPGRWKQIKGQAVQVQMSEIQTELTTGAQCEDAPGWQDDHRHGCDRYKSKEWCSLTGVVTENWKGHNRWFFWQRKYSIQERADKAGISALDACCVCGGGQATASVMIATSTTYSAPEEAVVTTTPMLVTTTENTQKTCGSEKTCTRDAELGYTLKEGFEEEPCLEAGCTVKQCCDPTCSSEVNACPIAFISKSGHGGQRCKEDSCDPFQTCCSYDADAGAALFGDVSCQGCDAGTYLEFDIKMTNGDYNKFEMGTNRDVRSQYERAVIQSSAAAMSPHVASNQIRVEFSQGSIIAKVLVKVNSEEDGFKLKGRMTKALFKADSSIKQSDFEQTLLSRMPDVSTITASEDAKPIFEDITNLVVGAAAAGRDVRGGGLGDWRSTVKDLPVIGAVAKEVGEVNAIALILAGLLVFGFCCFANILNGDDDDFRHTSEGGMQGGQSAGSVSSNISSGRQAVPHGKSATSVRSGASTANSAAGGASSGSSRADRAVAATIKVNVFGRSPPYPLREEPREDMRFYHEWTSGMLDIEHDFTQAACAVCCPVCFLPWRIRVTIEKVGAVEGVCCSMTKDNNWMTSVFCAFAYLVGVILINHKAYCNQVVKEYGLMSGTTVCDHVVASWFPGDNTADLQYEDISITWYMLLVLPMVWRQLVMHKGIASRYQIQENDIIAFIKAIVFTPFASMQSGRHVDTYYKEHTVKRLTDVPKLPLLGTPIKIRPGPVVDDMDDDLDKR